MRTTTRLVLASAGVILGLVVVPVVVRRVMRSFADGRRWFPGSYF